MHNAELRYRREQEFIPIFGMDDFGLSPVMIVPTNAIEAQSYR